MKLAPKPSPPALSPHFTVLYRRHYDFVWRCAMRLGGDEAIVDDLVQETFLIALRRLDDFQVDGPAQPSTWLFAILRNVLRSHRRGQRRRARRHQQVRELQAPHWTGGSEEPEAAARYLALGRLQRFIDELEPERRAVFVLAELQGCNSREVGESLGISPNTARTRLRAARAAFAQTFHDDPLRPRVIEALESGHRDPPKPDAERRRHTLQAISGLAAGDLTLASTPGVTASLGLAGALNGLALAGLGLALALVAAAAFALASGSGEPPVSKGTDPAKYEPGPVPGDLDLPPPVAPAPSIVVRPAPKPKPRPRPPEAPPEDPKLQELRVLAGARAALLAKDGEDALLRLRRADPWSDAELGAQALGLELGALCSLARGAEAHRTLERWGAEHPDHLIDPRLRGLCW